MMTNARILTPWLTDGVNRPQLPGDHPCSWQDVTGQQSYQLPTLPNSYVIEALDVDQDWLDDVAADDTYVILWSGEPDAEPDALTEQQLTNIRAKLAIVGDAQLDYYVGDAPDGRTQDEFANELVTYCAGFLRQDEMEPEAYAALVNRHEQWSGDSVSYAPGRLLAHEGALYEVIEPGHTSQAGWQPPNVPALFKLTVPVGVIPVWVQPQGAHDAYSLGARVTHSGQVWESTHNGANVWEPGVFGWVVVE